MIKINPHVIGQKLLMTFVNFFLGSWKSCWKWLGWPRVSFCIKMTSANHHDLRIPIVVLALSTCPRPPNLGLRYPYFTWYLNSFSAYYSEPRHQGYENFFWYPDTGRCLHPVGAVITQDHLAGDAAGAAAAHPNNTPTLVGTKSSTRTTTVLQTATTGTSGASAGK